MAYPTSDANRLDELSLIGETLIKSKSRETPCNESVTRED